MASDLDTYFRQCEQLLTDAKQLRAAAGRVVAAPMSSSPSPVQRELESVRRDADQVRRRVEVSLESVEALGLLADRELRTGGPPVLSFDEVARKSAELQRAAAEVVSAVETPPALVELESTRDFPWWVLAAAIGFVVSVVAALVLFLA